MSALRMISNDEFEKHLGLSARQRASKRKKLPPADKIQSGATVYWWRSRTNRKVVVVQIHTATGDVHEFTVEGARVLKFIGEVPREVTRDG